MEAASHTKPRPAYFDRFLAWLDYDAKRALATYESTYKRLVRILRRRFPQSAHDMASDALLRTVSRFQDGSYLDGVEPIRYINGVVANLQKEGFRALAKEPDELVHEPADEQPGIHELLERDADLRQLSAALNTLKEEQRDVLIRYYTDDRALLASELGIDSNALAARANYYRAKLRERLLAR